MNLMIVYVTNSEKMLTFNIQTNCKEFLYFCVQFRPKDKLESQKNVLIMSVEDLKLISAPN